MVGTQKKCIDNVNIKEYIIDEHKNKRTRGAKDGGTEYFRR